MKNNKNIIKYFDLKEQYKSIKDEIDKKAIEVIKSSSYSLGKYVDIFEDEFANFNRSKYCIGLNTGTSALHLALLASNIGQGDEVITVSMTFIATVMAISYVGAKPVFVDINEHNKLIDITKIEEKITSRTKAIIPVHLYGQCADMKEINKIAKKHNLTVIEDASQAHGALLNNKNAGTYGNIGTFSFYPGKNLGAYGEGGALITDNYKIKRKVESLRNWAQSNNRYKHNAISYNYRMDGIQAGILSIKLKKLNYWTEKRRYIANIYQSGLKDVINCTLEEKNKYHVYHIFSVFHKNSKILKDFLNTNNVATNNHYPIPVHKQKPYKNLNYTDIELPNTVKCAKQQLSLPMYPELKKKDVLTIISLIKKWKFKNK
ncbi:DegT/DnrJ/EryC1/StrS family aminotransferase [Pelagibacteraceae bacterium]|nr:DegT/DnrJ/EryC1/StrS family aminotransferase [Pelagibacteraceae bacterium]